MDFNVQFYRIPDSRRDVIIIGRAKIGMKGIYQILPPADPMLYQALKKYFQRLLFDGGPPPALLASVRRTIAEALVEGNPNLTSVAAKLEVGPRTLQRRLSKSGTDFKQLVDDTRSWLALRYLKDTNKTITEVALLLGYSEVSAFNRAFKRWTESAPLEYRRAASRGRPNKF